jgi:hypothetical protein
MSSFSLKELSVYDSKPVELYLFSNGDKVWAATSADEDITLSLDNAVTNTATKMFKGTENPVITGSHTFKSMAIGRTEVSNSSELNRSYINITVPRTFGVAQLYSYYPPSSITAITIFRYHRNTGRLETNLYTEFLGRVVNASGIGVTTELRCEPITTSIKRIGLTQMFQRQCPHILYDPTEGGCRVDKSLFVQSKQLDTVVGLNGLTLTFASSLVGTGKPLGYYNGGMVNWKTGNYTYWRWILNQPTEFTLEINFPVPLSDTEGVNPLDWAATKSIDIYPGCAHTMTDCRMKFSNLDNYGGDPYIPLMNPFGGSMLGYGG